MFCVLLFSLFHRATDFQSILQYLNLERKMCLFTSFFLQEIVQSLKKNTPLYNVINLFHVTLSKKGNENWNLELFFFIDTKKLYFPIAHNIMSVVAWHYRCPILTARKQQSNTTGFWQSLYSIKVSSTFTEKKIRYSIIIWICTEWWKSIQLDTRC